MNDLLKKLYRKKITINLINGQLDIKAPKGVMTLELLSEIKAHKQALISLLSEYKLETEINTVIPKVAHKPSYALSSSQYKSCLLQEIEKRVSAYNMSSLFSLKGALNIQNLEKETGIPKQYIKPFRHKNLPFEEIVRIVNPERIPGKHPTFQTLFNMVQLAELTTESNMLNTELYEGNWDNNKYDITLYVNSQKELQLELVYNTSLFENAYIEAIKEDYITIVHKIVVNPNLKINEITKKTINSNTQGDLWKEILN